MARTLHSRTLWWIWEHRLISKGQAGHIGCNIIVASPEINRRDWVPSKEFYQSSFENPSWTAKPTHSETWDRFLFLFSHTETSTAIWCGLLFLSEPCLVLLSRNSDLSLSWGNLNIGRQALVSGPEKTGQQLGSCKNSYLIDQGWPLLGQGDSSIRLQYDRHLWRIKDTQ